MLLSVCKVISWLDWWLSTCGSFQKHLADEEHGHFERLMLFGSRALEFLGGQGVTALGVLVLSRRDSLLLAVRSTVWLKSSLAYVMLIFPRLLAFSLFLHDSALNKMRAASNDALVQWTLHPPKLPRKSSAVPVQAGSLEAPHPWCLSCRCRRRRPLFFLCPAGSDEMGMRR